MPTKLSAPTMDRQEASAMDAPSLARPHEGLLRWLRDHRVDLEVHEHAEAFTAVSTARAEGVDAHTFAKVVGVAADDGRKALMVVDAQDRLDLHKAREVLGARDVRLLTEQELAELAPGCEPGALPAVGPLFGVPMHVDFAIRDDLRISFNAGTHRHSVRVDRSGWERAVLVQYADLAADVDERPVWARS
jgi:Ala-tRNA(Pro) deacylase